MEHACLVGVRRRYFAFGFIETVALFATAVEDLAVDDLAVGNLGAFLAARVVDFVAGESVPLPALPAAF